MKKIFFCLVFLSAFLSIPHLAFAQSEQITSFKSTITSQSDGSLSVSENIIYDFGDNIRHGIFRTIPLSTKVGNLYRLSQAKVISVTMDGASEPYSVTNSGSNETIKIGDPNQTISGSHLYTLSYNISNSISTFTDHDEIYWNVTGNDWQVPIDEIKTTVSTPNTTPLKATCYTGLSGSTNQDCNYSQTGDVIEFTSLKPFGPGEGLSIVVSYPLGTFPTNILNNSNYQNNSVTTSNNIDLNFNSPLLLGYLGLTNILLPIIAIIWFFKTKHMSRFGKVTVNFDIPKDSKGNIIYPAEAGVIDNATLVRDDIVGTLFDLAIRKKIKLENEESTSSFLGIKSNSQKFYITKLENYEDEPEFVKILLDRVFADGDRVDVSTLKSDFYMFFTKIQDSVISGLVNKGLLKYNPTGERNGTRALGVVSIFFGGVLLGIILLILATKLYGRTDTGDELDWRIEGLKLFLKNMSREYKWQAEQLIIVEKMIPYAMALGYIDQYMEQLKIIKPNYQPYWYSGRTPFYNIYPVMFTSLNSGFAMAAPSSSSGFGGGGFSGGGGGGGGGGSW